MADLTHEHDWRRLPLGTLAPERGKFMVRDTLYVDKQVEWCPGCREIRNVPSTQTPDPLD